MKNTIKLFLGFLCLVATQFAAARHQTPATTRTTAPITSTTTVTSTTTTTIAPTTNVVLRQYERLITLAPGERGNIASVCLSGETVVGGGPTTVPAQLEIVYSSLIFDGVRSGWAVEWINKGTDTVVVTPRTGALCVNGTMTLG